MLKEFDTNKCIKKKINYIINENNDKINSSNRMRETNNSLKGIFTIRNNGMIKKLLINKKSADLINLSEL